RMVNSKLSFRSGRDCADSAATCTMNAASIATTCATHTRTAATCGRTGRTSTKIRSTSNRRRTAPAERRTAGVAGYAATPARRSFPSQTRPPAPRRVSSMQQTRQEHPMYARSTPVPLAVVSAVVLAGCGGGAGSQAGHEPVPVRSTDVVTQEELGRVATASTLYEALHALRPGWFRRNPTTLRPQTEGDVVVYVDQSRLGGPE